MKAGEYFTIAGPATASIEVKRSVFRCDLFPVSDERAARAAIDSVRKQYWDARHHCSAFILGPDVDVRRSSDDGEPSGTAGMPMLDVLAGADLTDVVAVVTRWFGGTLLGTGGLVKAYGDATRAGLAVSSVERYEQLVVLRTEVAPHQVGRLEHAVRAAGFIVVAVEYGVGSVQLKLGVPADAVERAQSLLAEQTGGANAFEQMGHLWVKT